MKNPTQKNQNIEKLFCLTKFSNCLTNVLLALGSERVLREVALRSQGYGPVPGRKVKKRMEKGEGGEGEEKAESSRRRLWVSDCMQALLGESIEFPPMM